MEWKLWQFMNSGIREETIVTSGAEAEDQVLKLSSIRRYNSETGFWTRAADFSDPVATVGHNKGALYSKHLRHVCIRRSVRPWLAQCRVRHWMEDNHEDDTWSV